MNYITTTQHNSDVRLGPDLARLRENAGVKQAKIAQALRVDASRISRIETGQIAINSGEVAEFARAIGTDEAKEYAEYYQREWAVLEKPSFWHPSRRVLEVAEQSLVKLNEFTEKSETTEAARAQAHLHRESMTGATKYLHEVSHSIAFVGEIGVGKTTAICAITDLILPPDPKAHVGFSKRAVLETGSGRTTLCEVVMGSGDEGKFGIVVHPYSHDEIFQTVRDFCQSLVDTVKGADNSSTNDGESRGISEEMSKALRNMAKLTRRQEKGADGKVIRTDPAMLLTRECNNDLTQLTAEVFKRMRLDQRTTTELRFESLDLDSGLRELRERFASINKGMSSEFSLPRRIDLTVPVLLLGEQPFDVRVVDTKGVDDTAIRPDIRAYLDDPRTVAVLCSRFSNAPDTILKGLMENLVSTGAEDALSERVVLLVLARREEVLGMKDDLGEQAETAEDGYKIKSDEIGSELAKINGAKDLPIWFLDVLNDDYHAISKDLADAVVGLRNRHAQRITQISQAMSDLIKRHGEAESREAQDRVRHRLRIFIEQHLTINTEQQNPYQMFIRIVNARHPQTVWASTRRNGAWSGLDAYHLIGTGTAIDAKTRTQPLSTGLNELLENMLGDIELEPAHDYLTELRQAAQSWRQKFLNEATISGRETFRAALYADGAIWSECVNEWGEGPGYRERVARHLEVWCKRNSHLTQAVERQVQQEWIESFLKPLAALCGSLDLLDKDAVSP